jgi:hypothetical protein
MTAGVKPLVEINREPMRLLYRELGVVHTVRFLRQFTSGFGDYTEDREGLFGNRALPEVLKEIEK